MQSESIAMQAQLTSVWGSGLCGACSCLLKVLYGMCLLACSAKRWGVREARAPEASFWGAQGGWKGRAWLALAGADRVWCTRWMQKLVPADSQGLHQRPVQALSLGRNTKWA